MRPAHYAVAAALAAGLALTGCTAQTGDEQSSEPTPSTSSAAPKSTPLPTPPDFGEGTAGVAADVTITECQLAAGDVVAKGTAVNSATEARDLAIIVIWLKSDSGTPLGSGMVVLPQMAPGEVLDWQLATQTVDLPERCVLNATAGQPLPDAEASPAATETA